MGLLDGFPFKSREQLRREEADFSRRVLPLGTAQRDAALALLRELVPGRRVQDTDRLFAFLSAKDHYTRCDGPDAALAAARAELQKQRRRMTDQELNAVLALIVLDTQIESLENYPNLQHVRQLAAAL